MARMKSYFAPCKVNLRLKVLGKRDDGFHEVDMIMAPLGLCDELRFEEVGEMGEAELVCDVPGVPTDGSNLVMKAVGVFEERTGRRTSYRIELIKRVPHGAGLGGGSSDAATTLLALNELEGTGLTRGELLAMSAELGSDVGFFIDPRICRCTGRGEKVDPMPELDGFREAVVLLKPGFSVSTPDAYRRWQGSRFLDGVFYGEQEYGGIGFVNDLERPVFEKYLFLPEMKQWLLAKEGVKTAMMSGSGSTMFAVVGSVEEGEVLAERAKAELDPTLWSWAGMCGFVAAVDENLTRGRKRGS